MPPGSSRIPYRLLPTRADSSDNDIRDAGFSALALAIERGNLRKLRSLYFVSNRVTDEGAAALAKAIANNKRTKVRAFALPCAAPHDVLLWLLFDDSLSESSLPLPCSCSTFGSGSSPSTIRWPRACRTKEARPQSRPRGRHSDARSVVYLRRSTPPHEPRSRSLSPGGSDSRAAAATSRDERPAHSSAA